MQPNEDREKLLALRNAVRSNLDDFNALTTRLIDLQKDMIHVTGDMLALRSRLTGALRAPELIEECDAVNSEGARAHG